MRMFWAVMALLVLTASGAQAHRVNIFAYVENGDVVVECSFSRSSPVMHGTVIVTEAGSGREVLRGETDDKGLFRFPIPQNVLAARGNLNIRIQAGEGHQNDWEVTAEEMGAAAEPAGQTASAVAAENAPMVAASGTTPGSAVVAVSPAELERIVGAALDARLAPIKRMLLEQTEAGPGIREIVGGLGWIFGLVGVAAYFRSRPRV